MLAARNVVSATEQAASAAARVSGAGGSCTICFEHNPQPIQSGCGCRGDSGLAHVACRATAAEYVSESRPDEGGTPWRQCGTCGQRFLGAMALGLVCEWWRHVQHRPEADHERAIAAMDLGVCLHMNDRLDEASSILHAIMKVVTNVWGYDGDITVDVSIALAALLGARGKVAECETIYRRCYAERTRLYGPDHEKKMSPGANFAMFLSHPDNGKYDEALPIFRTCLAFYKRTVGLESIHTLMCATSMSAVLVDTQRTDEAMAVLSEILPISKRVLGPDHMLTKRIVETHAECVVLSTQSQ
jgi:hypothetical protein